MPTTWPSTGIREVIKGGSRESYGTVSQRSSEFIADNKMAPTRNSESMASFVNTEVVRDLCSPACEANHRELAEACKIKSCRIVARRSFSNLRMPMPPSSELPTEQVLGTDSAFSQRNSPGTWCPPPESRDLHACYRAVRFDVKRHGPCPGRTGMYAPEARMFCTVCSWAAICHSGPPGFVRGSPIEFELHFQ